jgi:hypothetical protein
MANPPVTSTRFWDAEVNATIRTGDRKSRPGVTPSRLVEAFQANIEKPVALPPATDFATTSGIMNLLSKFK